MNLWERCKERVRKSRENTEINELKHDLMWKVYTICERYKIKYMVGHEFVQERLIIVCFSPDDPLREVCSVYFDQHDKLACRIKVNRGIRIRGAGRPLMELQEYHEDIRWLRQIDILYRGILNADIEDARKRFSPWKEAYGS